MSALNLALLFIGGLALVLGLTTGFFKRKVYLLSEPMLALGLGIVLGPAVLDVLNLEAWGDPMAILEQVARLAIAIAVMSISLRLPRGYFRRWAGTMGAVLGLGMLFMWVVSGLLVWALLGVGFWTAMLAGAVVTPTDPVLAGTIVNGEMAEEHIPARLRHNLSAESGANDGGAYPFVFLAIYMLTMPAGEAWKEWALNVLLWEVLAAVVVGVVVGWIIGRIQVWSEDRDYMSEASMLTVTVAMAFTVLAAVKLMGSDGILAVFAAGMTFNNVTSNEQEMEEQNVQESISRLFFLPVFVLFGLALPWEGWAQIGWGRLSALAVLILLLRRPPMMPLIAPIMAPLRKRADVLFNGWFGPIGVAAIFYATLSRHHVHDPTIWYVGSFIVVASVVAHGVTSTPFTLLYGRRALEPSDTTGD